MNVAAILRHKPVQTVETISPSAQLSDAAAVLSAKRYGALVCSTDGETVEGMISERDIVRVLGVDGPSCMDRSIASVMTKTVKTCAPEDTVEDVLHRMSNGRFRHMPVVVEGKMVGLVSLGDIVKERIDMLEHEASALTEMIKGY